MSDNPREQLDAVLRAFWKTRVAQQGKQAAAGKRDAGNRGAATGGGHLNALTEWIRDTFEGAGIAPSNILSGRRLTIPGFFRPCKDWDLVLYNGRELGAAIELKSHIGPSFGNNFNNRVEEAIGNAKDVRVAFRESLLGDEAPWLAYVMVLETVAASVRPTKTATKVFAVDPELDGASYKQRYEHLCRRLVREQLYDATCLVPTISEPVPGVDLEYVTIPPAVPVDSPSSTFS